MKVTVQPRMQQENWSLYWKESLRTESESLPNMDLDLDADLPNGATLKALLEVVARKQGWPEVQKLIRLEGFRDPWERVLLRGRNLDLNMKIANLKAKITQVAASLDSAPPLTVVRTRLVADGWAVKQDGDFLSDSDSDY